MTISRSILASCLVAGAAGAFEVVVEPGSSLEAVRGRVREMRASRPGETGTVLLKAGRYELAEPLRLGPKDSGVTWKAAGNGEVRISGGVILTVPPRPLADEKLRARLPDAAKGRVVCFDLRAQGLSDFGDYLYNPEDAVSRRVAREWGQGEAAKGSHPPPEGSSGSGHLEVFFDDRPLQVARTPTGTVYHIEKLLGPIRPTGPTGKKRASPEGRFVYREDAPSKWAGEPDPHVCGCWMTDWAEQHQRIEKLDVANKTMLLSKPWHQYLYCAGKWFYSFNLLCELDEPGEWFLDRGTGMLAMWPPVQPGKSKIEVSRSKRLVEITGAHDVAFEGVTFEVCRNAAIYIKDCTNCEVRASVVRNAGNHGVVIDNGRSCGVRDSKLYGLGGGCVWMMDANYRSLVPSGHYAVGCDMHHFGRWNRMYRPGVFLSGVGMRAERNFIHDSPHAAVLFFGCDHLMASNEIARVCRESMDCGAFYTGRSWLLRGNRIVGNHFHDIIGLNGHYTRTVYLDDSFASAEISGNRFERCTWCVFIGGARENVITNNVFVDCPEAIHIDIRGKNWQEKHLKGRIAWMKSHPWYLKEPFISRYPGLATVLDGDPYAPQKNVIANNTFIRGKGEWIARYGHNRIKDSPLWWRNLQMSDADAAKYVWGMNVITNNTVVNPPNLRSSAAH